MNIKELKKKMNKRQKKKIHKKYIIEKVHKAFTLKNCNLTSIGGIQLSNPEPLGDILYVIVETKRISYKEYRDNKKKSRLNKQHRNEGVYEQETEKETV